VFAKLEQSRQEKTMKFIRSTVLLAQILTGALCLSPQVLAQPVPNCCQRMDGNRQVGIRDSQTVKLNEVFATLVIDSVRNRDSKWFSFIRVLNKTKVDTSLFSDVFGFGPGMTPIGSGSIINYTPSDFPDSHTDSLDFPVRTSGDTLKNVFVLQVDPGNGRKEWHLSGIQCKFLTGNNPPFPFPQALGNLNRFLDSAAVANGGTAGKNGLKMGPVFIPDKGDIGLQITANHDDKYWFVYKLVGSGDCPAGCTQHEETLYRMDAQGNVLIVSIRKFFALCWASETTRRPGIPASTTLATGCFTADGRKVDQSPASRPTRARILRSALPK
jgi:hypothetical protein